jgi:hypothetical protein
VGLPDAILFLRISRVGVFQQPQAITLFDLSLNVIAAPLPLLDDSYLVDSYVDSYLVGCSV